MNIRPLTRKEQLEWEIKFLEEQIFNYQQDLNKVKQNYEEEKEKEKVKVKC